MIPNFIRYHIFSSTFLLKITFFLLISHSLSAQEVSIPLSNSALHPYESHLHVIDNPFFTTSKPFSSFQVQPLRDSILETYKMDSDFASTTWFGRKIFNENLFDIQHKDYRIIINPLFDLSLGKDNMRDRLLFNNTRGFQISGRIGDNFHYNSEFYENQSQFTAYLNEFVGETKVVPGQGLTKGFKQNGGRDYASVAGYLSYQANKFFNFQLGYGKNFLGDGYRSLLLSDNAFNYPYFKITTSFWKIQYVNLYTEMLDIRQTNPDGLFLKKHVISHALSWNVTKRLNVTLFEAVTYQDSTGTRGFELSYLNPIIFYRPVEFALGSRGGNVLFGLNLKYKATDKIHFYGQIVLDEFKFSEIKDASGWWANKYGLQLGFKSFHTFIPNLTVQSEFNWVRPFTYSHITGFQNYAHYNQALAHPLGANFMESVSHIRYQHQRLFAALEIMYALQGRDTDNSNWGTNIYLNNATREQDFGNETLQGVKTTTFLTDFKVGYILNPQTNLRLELGVLLRNFEPETTTNDLNASKTNYFYFGMTTRINNRYYDF